MREKMERLVLLPFSAGCVSESSVAVAVQQQPRKSKADSTTNPSHSIRTNKDCEEECDDESLSGESNKSSFRSLSLPKPNISTGIHRLVKGFKSFSQYFVYKDIEIDEMEMEIGDPTDVKHVTHIGWDGSAATSDEALKGWENLLSPDSLSVPNWRRSFDFSVVPDHTHLLKGSAS